ncbi:hypothetical protein Emag_007247 [Eimeria magna]
MHTVQKLEEAPVTSGFMFKASRAEDSFEALCPGRREGAPQCVKVVEAWLCCDFLAALELLLGGPADDRRPLLRGGPAQACMGPRGGPTQGNLMSDVENYGGAAETNQRGLSQRLLSEAHSEEALFEHPPAVLRAADVFAVGWILESKRGGAVALQFDASQLHATLKLAQTCRRISDCPVVPLQGSAVDEAGTPDIPPCKARSERVTLEGVTNSQNHNAFDLTVSAASDLVTAKAMYTRCSRLVPEAEEDASFARAVRTKHLIAGLKALIDCGSSQGKELEGLVALLVPEDEALHGWLSVVLQIEGLECVRVLFVVPTAPRQDLIE